MLVLLTIFGCLYHASGIPIDDGRNISLLILPPSDQVGVQPTSQEIKDAVSQIMTNLKSNNKNANLIEAMIDEVESQVFKDPSLPRLTRGEILDIIENITREDIVEFEKGNNRAEHERAIMLVLPYTPENNTDNMEDLYTKPPVVKIVDEPKISSGNNLQEQELYTKPPIIKIIEDQLNGQEMKPVRRRRPTLPPSIPQADFSSTEKAKTTVFVTTSSSPPNTQPYYDSTKQTKFQPLKKYPPKTINKQKYSDQGMKVVPPPKLTWNPQNPQEDEILIAEESLPSKTSFDNYYEVPKEYNIKPHRPSDDMVNVDNLTPEMQKLLMSFGLVPDPTQKPIYFKPEAYYSQPETPNFEPESFVQFKPLPDSAPTREDMASLLESFGIESRSSKGKKNLKIEENSSPKEVDMDIFPDDVKDILADIGLSDRRGRKISLDGVEKYDKKNTHPTQNHFDGELEQLKKLKKLVGYIKKIDSLNATEDIPEDDLKEIKELVLSINENEKSNAHHFSKVNVKRQADITILKDSEDETTSSTTDVVDATPNLKDLEDSFGGTSSTTTTTTEPPSTTRKNGFYKLVDWNTFLEVDDQKGRSVSIKYQPRSGNPKEFYSISVP